MVLHISDLFAYGRQPRGADVAGHNQVPFGEVACPFSVVHVLLGVMAVVEYGRASVDDVLGSVGPNTGRICSA
jgi:hypothetical protein